MKTKIPLVAMITCLLLLANSIAFSQNSKVPHKKPATGATSEIIKSVIPNLSHHSISLTFANLDPQEEYKILLYNSENELMQTYSIDGNEMTLFVGALPPNNYEIVVTRGNYVVDKKEIFVQ